MLPSNSQIKVKPLQRLQANDRLLKRKRETEQQQSLQAAIDELDPKLDINAFSELPLSRATASGLEASHFRTLTQIQSKALPLALKGRDILGAAKTGSGKTLAFLVPVLEVLIRNRWTELDGLGALIISPTRELAMQIFEVLRKIGRYHTLSAGLVIGGRSLQEERNRLGRMNILVCTPGRMLQHMDQTAAFDVDNLKMLVLDEADRIMDMGFQTAVDAIVEHLPQSRQTLLFSATQTRQISDLARLSLQYPEYVAVHETASSATPTTLQQHYVLTPLPQKLNTLYGFLKSNLKAKIIVFFSSGKQVRFAYESLRRLQPGIPLLHLHGRQKQFARLGITSKFSASNDSCIFATDIVARGLDFPAVDWVIQMDCPEDADTYIHRVGRTARYERAGRAVLFLDPGEEQGFLRRLGHRKVPIEKINIKAGKQQDIRSQLQNMCFQNPELKYLGQKAFASYIRSLFVQKDKDIFDINRYDLEAYAASLGLPGAPKIKFRRGDDVKSLKNAPRGMLESTESDSDDDGKKKMKENVRTKYDRMFERCNQDIFSEHYSKMIAQDVHYGAEEDTDDDNAFLAVKRLIPMDKDVNLQGESFNLRPVPKVIEGAGKKPFVIDSKRREKLLQSKRKFIKLKDKGTKLVFDDNGVAHALYELEDEDSFKSRGTAEVQRAKFLDQEAARVRNADTVDKNVAKDKKRTKKEKRKERVVAESEGMHRAAPGLVGNDIDNNEMPLMASFPLAGRNTTVVKRAKKWFEDGSDHVSGNKIKQSREYIAKQDVLENIEALAAGLLS